MYNLNKGSFSINLSHSHSTPTVYYTSHRISIVYANYLQNSITLF